MGFLTLLPGDSDPQAEAWRKAKVKDEVRPVTVPITGTTTETNTAPLVYVTYIKINSKTGEIYIGRSSGRGTPEQIVRTRDANHHKTSQDFGKATLDKHITSNSNGLPQFDPAYQAIRGREQLVIQRNGGAWSSVGRGNTKSGNAINGISQYNIMRSTYINAARILGW